MQYFFTLLFVMGLISGCSTKPRQGDPAPIIQRSADSSYSVAPHQDGQVTITPLQTSSYVAVKPAPNKAVQLLHERAQQQMIQGDLPAAAKSLERALSISPRDAQSWNLLAHLRAKQNQYSMAIEIAAKSNTLAMENQKELTQDNLLLMAKMKRLLAYASKK